MSCFPQMNHVYRNRKLGGAGDKLFVMITSMMMVMTAICTFLVDSVLLSENKTSPLLLPVSELIGQYVSACRSDLGQTTRFHFKGVVFCGFYRSSCLHCFLEMVASVLLSSLNNF